MKMFTLLDGRQMTENELTKFYRANLNIGCVPIAGYFCPDCDTEMPYIGIKAQCKRCGYVGD